MTTESKQGARPCKCCPERAANPTPEHGRWWRIARPNGTPVFGFGYEYEASLLAGIMDGDDLIFRGDINCHQWTEAPEYDQDSRDDGFNLEDEIAERARDEGIGL